MAALNKKRRREMERKREREVGRDEERERENWFRARTETKWELFLVTKYIAR